MQHIQLNRRSIFNNSTDPRNTHCTERLNTTQDTHHKHLPGWAVGDRGQGSIFKNSTDAAYLTTQQTQHIQQLNRCSIFNSTEAAYKKLNRSSIFNNSTDAPGAASHNTHCTERLNRYFRTSLDTDSHLAHIHYSQLIAVISVIVIQSTNSTYHSHCHSGN